MASQNNKRRTRTKNGYPSLQVVNDRLRLRFTFDRQQYYLNLKMEDTERNRVIAADICETIYFDLTRGRAQLDNLESYLPIHLQSRLQILPSEQISTIQELWIAYVQSEAPSLAESTQIVVIKPLSKKLQQFPVYTIGQDESKLIQRFSHLSTLTQKNQLSRIVTAYRWAEKNNLIPKDSHKLIEVPKVDKDEIAPPDPFETWEITNLLNRCSESGKHDLRNLIQLLLFTGARPSEAFALRLNDVNLKTRTLTFDETRNVINGQLVSKNRLKTQKKRIFPINDEFAEFLAQLTKGKDMTSHEFLLTVDGKPWDSQALQRYWVDSSKAKSGIKNGIIPTLVREGLIDHYRTPYACRDTFITHSIYAKVPTSVIAKWVGNSPRMIDEHYFALLKGDAPPSLYT